MTPKSGPKKFDADEFKHAIAAWRKRMEEFQHDVPSQPKPLPPRDQRLPREPGEEG